ncbi:MAG: hypothetical protein H6607_09070 [Flavobacteriales bacterium]|nr:hypothetical protein [Flavobacteriales bacterium]
MTLLEIFGQNVTQGPGTETFTDHLIEIVLMLLAAFLLGWWISRILASRYKRKVHELTLEMEGLRASSGASLNVSHDLASAQERLKGLENKNAALLMELTSLKEKSSDNSVFEARIKTLEQINAQLKSDLEACKNKISQFAEPAPIREIVSAKPETMVVNAPAAAPSQKDDLKKIEGIGPKIEKLLNEDGVFTFAQMVAAGVDRIQAVLDKAGPQFRVHDPGTWTEQAKLAANGQWDELLSLQDILKGGKRV